MRNQEEAVVDAHAEDQQEGEHVEQLQRKSGVSHDGQSSECGQQRRRDHAPSLAAKEGQQRQRNQHVGGNEHGGEQRPVTSHQRGDFGGFIDPLGMGVAECRQLARGVGIVQPFQQDDARSAVIAFAAPLPQVAQ
ncbi:MAG: hypothetical protein FWC42_02625 [Proteobacteria bacterium]|nr:hypothetical protein [Pseudomonadota bacterium]